MTDIKMPRLTDAMEEGVIVRWLIDPGEEVDVGAELVEIETDKATTSYHAEAAGALEILVPVDTTVAVGETIARVGAKASAAATTEETQPATTEEAQPATTVEAKPVSNGMPAPPSAPSATGVRTTPLARRIATAHSVDLEALTGSGPGGRIVKSDVLRAAGLEEEQPAAAEPVTSTVAPIPSPSVRPAAGSGGNVIEPTRLQQTVARRMSEAKATIPHFQVETEVAMDAALRLREELREATDEDRPLPSINDLIVRAAALTLRRHPLVNGSYQGGAYKLHDEINIGIAVAADSGLVVATIRDADRRSVGEIALESRRLAAAVREGRVTAPDLAGGTFTVSNLGMFGMTSITAVINPPQAAILGVGAARDVLARVDGEIVDRKLLTMTLSGDHRILNGADGARFLSDLREALEAPMGILL